MPDQLQKRARPCFVTKSVRFRSFEVFLVPFESSRRDLESEHGFEACLKKKRLKLDFRASLSGYTKACGVGNLTTSSRKTKKIAKNVKNLEN